MKSVCDRKSVEFCFQIRCWTLFTTLFLLESSLTRTHDLHAETKDVPNILFAISDDQSWPYAEAYGVSGLKTPAFNLVAKEGVLFANAFCSSPGCSPCRAAILTGRHTWELEQAGTHASSFPAKFQVYPDMLEAAGYTIGYTGKGWGPGNFKTSGRTRNPAGISFQKRKLKNRPSGISANDYAGNFAEFLNSREKDKPFYFWYGATEPHRSYAKGLGLKQGKKLSEAVVPSFLPDTDEIRSDILDYYVEVEHFDTHLGRMIQLLKEHDELDNTLIIVTSDNGMPFPRAKANCYEYGIHAPLAVMWPNSIRSGRKIDDLISFIDFAPTILEAAQIDVPANMSGRSFLSLLTSGKEGMVDPSRKAVFSARERHSSSRWNNWTYPIRCIRTQKFLYIRNFRPNRWPAGDPAGFRNDSFGYYDIDGCPSKTVLIENRNREPYKKFFHLAVDKRPAEELFAIETDPGNVIDLSQNPKYQKELEALRTELNQELRRTRDPRILNGGDIYESYKRYSHIRTFPKPDDATEDK